VLGTGHSHALGKLNVMRNFPEWDLVGVCEPDDSWRQQRQQEESWQGLAWLEEAEVLDDPTIQMIAVESEVPQLLPLGEKAIAAGKHIHLDKPAGMDLPRWRALLDKSEQQGLIIQMGYMFRYNPGFNLVRQAVQVKIDVVEVDPYERGIRAHLNLGHTFGHAIEKVTEFAIPHGEAVAIGIVKAARLSRNLGLIDEGLVERILKIMWRLELPTDIALDSERWYAAMATDKKWQAGNPRLVVLKSLGEAAIIEGLSKEEICAVL